MIETAGFQDKSEIKKQELLYKVEGALYQTHYTSSSSQPNAWLPYLQL